MAAIKEIQVTLDCAEPARLAEFWCEVLGYVLPPVPEGFATWSEYHRSLPFEEQPVYFACSDPTGAGPRVLFQRVPEGKTVKNRVHIDVRAGKGLVGDERLATLEAESERLVKLGATHLYTQYADGENESCITLQDPEGNEFCLD
ncbi:VOC family protein [Streptomyces sp. NRRL B-24572]|uniref:VOC family protein n=1 Tax=Streptomyces sp. NRRL B-24572 TaxID=1962156 RepID=UPI000A3C9A38|nr:VOC family protein [Streptomyces sp. NRRL B-24572]